ncbi:hypothetical protein ENHAE0001_1393 [Enhydrobacter aerosaccus SK60]|nr:hypothetical protein ENHAE0001_1393 [Enhydrobacter aerosaccus SK60]
MNKKQCNKKRIVKAIRFFIDADSGYQGCLSGGAWVTP